MSQGEPGQEIILPRGSGSRKNTLPARGNLLHNGIPAYLHPVEHIEHIFRCEILKVQKVVSLVEIFHDPVRLRIKEDCNSGRFRNKSKNRAVEPALGRIIQPPTALVQAPIVPNLYIAEGSSHLQNSPELTSQDCVVRRTVSDSMSFGKQLTAPPKPAVEPMKIVAAGSRRS